LQAGFFHSARCWIASVAIFACFIHNSVVLCPPDC